MTPDRTHALSVLSSPNSQPLYSSFPLRSSDGLAGLAATLPAVQSGANGVVSLCNGLGGLGEDQLDVARVRHVGVDLKASLGEVFVRRWIQHTRPWARYVRLRCLGAWLTWMCLTIKLLVSRPLVSALASAFLRRPRRNSADLTGQRALETPKALPVIVRQHLTLKIALQPRLQSQHRNQPSRESTTASFCLRFSPVSRLKKRYALTLCGAASAASVPPHGDGLLVLQNIAEVGEGALKLPSVDGLGSLAGVLEGGAEVAAASPRGLLVGDLSSVADLGCQLAGVADFDEHDACIVSQSQHVHRRATYHRGCAA